MNNMNNMNMNNSNYIVATAPPMDEDEVTIGIYYQPPPAYSNYSQSCYSQPKYPPPVYLQPQPQPQPQPQSNKNKEDECCCVGLMSLFCSCCFR
jgi:hypothetical protein